MMDGGKWACNIQDNTFVSIDAHPAGNHSIHERSHTNQSQMHDMINNMANNELQKAF